MTTFSPFSKLAPARRLFLALGALVLVGISWTASAGAVVTTLSTGTGNVTIGLQPRYTTAALDGTANAANFDNPAGNPVVHGNDTYAVYWDPTDNYHGDWQGIIDGFFNAMASSSGSFGSVFSVDSQYVDRTNKTASYNSTFRGAYTDTNPYPALGGCTDPHPLSGGLAITCLTDAQVQQQLSSFISQHNLPKGMNSIFYLLMPPGVTVCIDAGGPTGHCSDFAEHPAPNTSYDNSFCSYHGAISPTNPATGDGNTILYGVIPWTAGGFGDWHLASVDQTFATECQDGGFDASNKEIEKKEKAKEVSPKEASEFGEKSLEEQAKIERTRELEGPHPQEPNQHEGIGPDGTNDEGLADLIVNQVAVEQQNIITNPLLNAWQDPAKNEVTDECRNWFAETSGGSVTANEFTGGGTLYNQTYNEHNYYLNTAFNLASVRLPYPAIPCLPGIRLEPEFTSPSTVNSGDIVGFDGMESDITLNANTNFSAAGATQANYATYKWEFGDGTPAVTGAAPGGPSVNSPGASPCASPWLSPCAGSAFHSYQYGGTYQVTLTVTDTGGNSASITHPVTVVGPPPPGSPSGEAGSGSGAGTGTGSGGGTTIATVPGPLATQALTSKSLKTALNKGLLIRFSVNEQVAGSFDVLLASSLARRLHIHGSTAQGLPAGSAPQVIIAHAILVTTKGGRSSVRIKFPKATVTHLRKQKKVSVTLRLIVRNASPVNPASTTVLSTYVLRG